MKVIIVGSGGAGKDFFAKKLIKRGAIKSVSYTTRPIRSGETDGVDYHFITEEGFKEKINSDFWYEWDCFRGWYYGASKIDMEESDLFIKTVSGVMSLKKEDREKYTVIYLDIPEEVRRERLEARNDDDDVDRRIMTDKQDFDTFTDYDIVIKNIDF